MAVVVAAAFGCAPVAVHVRPPPGSFSVEPPRSPSRAARFAAGERAVLRGIAAYHAGRFEDAARAFEHGSARLAGHPNRWMALYDLARSYERAFRYDRALDAWQRFLREAPPSQRHLVHGAARSPSH